MPHSNLFTLPGCPEPGAVPLFLKFATTTSGAVGTVARKRGFGTPVRTGAGAYTIALSDRWPTGSLLSVRAYPVGGGAFDAATPNREAAILATDENGSAPNITIQFQRDDTGVAADVRNGASIVVEAWIKNLTV